MAYEFKINTEAATQEVGGSAFGTLDTGIYDVTLDTVSLDTTAKGNNTVNIGLTTSSGHQTTLWGMCIDEKWKSGAENFDLHKWSKIQTVGQMKTGEQAPFKILKDDGSVLKEVVVFKELSGLKLKLAIQKKLDAYNGEAKESNIIFEVFDAEGKTTSGDSEKLGKIESRLKDIETKEYKKLGGQTSSPAEDIEDDDVPF